MASGARRSILQADHCVSDPKGGGENSMTSQRLLAGRRVVAIGERDGVSGTR